VPYQGWGSARNIYNNYNKITGAFKNFALIRNTALNAPKNGDIVWWGFYPGVTGLAGHVAICVGDGANVNNFISFDQNYPTGSSCHRQLHNYKGVLGWWHPLISQVV